jgi:glutathione S-transferase
MGTLTLYIWSYNYASWSMRPGLVLRASGLPFEQVCLGEPGAPAALKAISPNGSPVLQAGDARVWDSLAISETIAEMVPDRGLWPADGDARSWARSLCAEMHAGFRTLRDAMPMNVRARHTGCARPPLLRADIARTTALWAETRGRFGSGGPYLFGAKFGIADAFFAPVMTRFRTYGVELEGAPKEYASALAHDPHVRDWEARAAAETFREDLNEW